MRRAKDASFESVLDLGCGDGRLCAELRAAYPRARIEGVDISERAIAFARAFAPKCDFHCADITTDEIVGGPFDLVFMIEVLEHIELNCVDPFLAAAGNLLAPGGRLLLTVPCCNVPLTGKHFQHFSRASLTEALRPHFRVHEIIPLNRISRWESIFFRLMCNHWLILSNPRLPNAMFKMYERRYLMASERDCRRLLAICTGRSSNDGREASGPLRDSDCGAATPQLDRSRSVPTRPSHGQTAPSLTS